MSGATDICYRQTSTVSLVERLYSTWTFGNWLLLQTSTVSQHGQTSTTSACLLVALFDATLTSSFHLRLSGISPL